MQHAEPAYASLTAVMIRRAPALPVNDSAAIMPMAEPAGPVLASASAWRDDLRLFAVTWATGFIFFLAFIG